MTSQTFMIQCICPFFFHALPAQLILQRHQQLSLTIYSVITATLHTLSNHHAQFLILGTAIPRLTAIEEQLYRDVQEIEKKKDTISEQLENIDWEAELRLERNNVNLSSEL